MIICHIDDGEKGEKDMELKKILAGVEGLKAKGNLEAGDTVILSGGKNFVGNVQYSKMMGGYLKI